MPDCRRSGVKDIDLVSLDHVPEAIEIGKIRRAFVHENRRTARQRAVNNVAVSRDPADVGCTPIDVVVFQIENQIRRVSDSA